jgi:hypothetical protein
MKREIVCFANSNMTFGRCFAGRDLEDKSWVRIVGSRPEGALAPREECLRERACDCANCAPAIPGPLDVISMELGAPSANGHRKENRLYVPRWELSGVLNTDFIEDFFDDPVGGLWADGYDSELGKNDVVPVTEMLSIRNSLFLIEAEWLVLDVRFEGEEFNKQKKRVRGVFSYKSKPYDILVTDAAIEEKFLALPEGRHVFGENRRVALCIALDAQPAEDGAPFSERKGDGGLKKNIVGVMEFGSTLGQTPSGRAVV